MKSFSSTSFLEGMWAKETGLGAENSLKVHFPNALSSYSESPTEISQLLQRHLQLHLWLEHPCFQEKHPSFSLWTPEGAWWGRDGKNRKKKLCFCFWVTLLPCVCGGGAGGGNIGFELARILKHFILTPTTSTRQEYVKFRVVHVLGCFDFKLLVRGVFLNPLLKHLRGLWQVGAPAPRQPRVPTTIPASQWGMRCLYTNWPLIVS